MYGLKKIERYLRANLLGPGPRLMKKRIYRAAVSQRLRNTDLRSTLSITRICGRIIVTLSQQIWF